MELNSVAMEAMEAKISGTAIYDVDDPEWIIVGDNKVRFITDCEYVIVNVQSVSWYKGKLLHRIGGPAIEIPSGGDRQWYLDGVWHRLDGPAIEWSNNGGTRSYYIYGNRVSKWELWRWKKKNGVKGPKFDWWKVWKNKNIPGKTEEPNQTWGESKWRIWAKKQVT